MVRESLLHWVVPVVTTPVCATDARRQHNPDYMMRVGPTQARCRFESFKLECHLRARQTLSSDMSTKWRAMFLAANLGVMVNMLTTALRFAGSERWPLDCQMMEHRRTLKAPVKSIPRPGLCPTLHISCRRSNPGIRRRLIDLDSAITTVGTAGKYALDINNSNDIAANSKFLIHNEKGTLDLNTLVTGTAADVDYFKRSYSFESLLTERTGTSFPVMGLKVGDFGCILVPSVPSQP